MFSLWLYFKKETMRKMLKYKKRLFLFIVKSWKIFVVLWRCSIWDYGWWRCKMFLSISLNEIILCECRSWFAVASVLYIVSYLSFEVPVSMLVVIDMVVIILQSLQAQMTKWWYQTKLNYFHSEGSTDLNFKSPLWC